MDSQSTRRQQVPLIRKGKTRMATDVIEELAGRHVHSVTRRTELLIEARSCAVSDPQLVSPLARMVAMVAAIVFGMLVKERPIIYWRTS
ncbi:MAG: hypothetical protein R3C59_27995 [Planctomycetaceae bacterium]